MSIDGATVDLLRCEVSRRAADVAMAIASACDCPVTALYVATSGANNGHKGRVFRARRQEQAIMKDMVEMADHYDVTAKTAVRSDLAPRDAILGEANKGAHDLIVMGVSRRPGDKLFFGDTAAAVAWSTSPARSTPAWTAAISPPAPSAPSNISPSRR